MKARVYLLSKRQQKLSRALIETKTSILFLLACMAFSALLGGHHDTTGNTDETSHQYENMGRTSMLIPPRKVSALLPDSHFDFEADMGHMAKMSHKRLLLGRLAVLVIMLAILTVGLLCRIFIPVPNKETPVFIISNVTTASI